LSLRPLGAPRPQWALGAPAVMGTLLGRAIVAFATILRAQLVEARIVTRRATGRGALLSHDNASCERI
jgi:hypothetical protein